VLWGACLRPPWPFLGDKGAPRLGSKSSGGRYSMIGAFLIGLLADVVFDAATASGRDYQKEMRAYLERQGLTGRDAQKPQPR
jgi:hypothetical protein